MDVISSHGVGRRAAALGVRPVCSLCCNRGSPYSLHRSKKVPAAQALSRTPLLTNAAAVSGEPYRRGLYFFPFLLHSFFISVGFPEIGKADVGGTDLGESDATKE